METGINISRKDILANYKWREGLIPLSLSKHAKRRVEERVDGEFPIVPTVVRITRNNICSGRGKGKKLTSVKIRLDYKTDKWMYLVICPNSGVVKTLYINYKDAKKNPFKKDECCSEEDSLKEETQVSGDNFEGERREGWNAAILSESVGEASSKETLLGMWWKNIWGKFHHILGPSTREK